MKLSATFLVLCVALLSHSTVAFLMDWMGKPTAVLSPALDAGTGALSAGTGALSAGTGALSAGTGALSAGALEAGTGALEAGTGALEAGVGAVTKPLSKGFSPLKFILASLGIPVDHLVEDSRKCVTELGPEAVGAVKTLLGALTFFG